MSRATGQIGAGQFISASGVGSVEGNETDPPTVRLRSLSRDVGGQPAIPGLSRSRKVRTSLDWDFYYPAESVRPVQRRLLDAEWKSGTRLPVRHQSARVTAKGGGRKFNMNMRRRHRWNAACLPSDQLHYHRGVLGAIPQCSIG
jgi:hypothetical protein